MDRRNSEGYRDPTVWAGMKNVCLEEDETQKRLSMAIRIIKTTLDALGFDLAERVDLIDRRSGRRFQ